MPASSISGPLPLAVKLTEQPKSPNLQTPALVTFTYQVKTLVGAKIKQARLFFTHQNITGLDVQMNHLTLMAMLQSTGDLHRYASSAIDLFVLRSQCLLTWSRKIKLFEPSEDIFRDPTKYWTTKKMWGGLFQMSLSFSSTWTKTLFEYFNYFTRISRPSKFGLLSCCRTCPLEGIFTKPHLFLVLLGELFLLLISPSPLLLWK